MFKRFPLLERLCAFLERHTVVFCLIYSVFVNLIVEMLCRQSFIDGIIHMFTSPAVFLFNASVVFSVSLISLFFKRRVFAVMLSTFPFIVLAVINCAVLTFRVNPVTAPDFVKISSILGIFGLYLDVWMIIAVIAAIALVAAGFVLLFRKSRKSERSTVAGVVAVPASIIAVTLAFNILLSGGQLSGNFKNLNDAYEDYGFIYCFSCSVFDTGIDRPLDYSGEKVDTILEKIRSEETLEPEVKPNIIFLQLESFFDVNNVVSLKYNTDPVPNFTRLKKEYPHGFLEVPYIGSGTANVEFEIMTGMSLDYFGPGEYPYKTVLQNTACESIAFNLKELGYNAHAIHNHKGTFYDRAHVFSNLGYDTFTSLEFMQDAVYNPIGWAKDEMVTDEILSCLDSTDGRDFIYAITVQSHGVYSPEPLENVDYVFDVEVKDPTTSVDEIGFEYYLTQINEVDAFVGELLAELSGIEEETVVVIYGDHLPYFELRDDETVNANVYQTEYVIWSNYGLEAEAKDLYAYELSAHIMGQLGMNNGLITKLHQNFNRDDEYFTSLEMLQYDMLYGKKECYGYEIAYVPSELRMGIEPIAVSDISNTPDEGVLVRGEGFTEFTRITINGDKKDTVFVDGTTLLVPDGELVYGDVVTALQTNGKRTVYAESEGVIYGEASEFKEVS